MTRSDKRRRAAAAAALAILLTVSAAPEPTSAQSDDSAVVRLIQLLIAKGVLTKDQAASLLAQAQSEAHASQAAAHPAKPKPKPGAAPAAATAVASAEPAAPALPKNTVRVTYVPQAVRDQIAAQVRDQVLGEEKANGWASPNAIPEWTQRITVYGDMRLRGERDLFDNANSNQLVDFNAINTGSPYDTLGTAAPPTINTLEDRTRFRVRARLGVKAQIDDWISSDIRLATGNDTSPVSENQTFGQNSNFGKMAIWLDRAYVTMQVPENEKIPVLNSAKAYVGRMMNPFWTSSLIYSDDLNMDGAAAALVAPIGDKAQFWTTGGAFVVYNTTFNYGLGPTYDQYGSGVSSRDKYLFGGQAGVDWKVIPAVKTKFAVGLFDYSNIEGKTSALCTITVSNDVCNTDNSRPQFAQFGNTYFPIRNINQAAGLNGTSAGFVTNPQYYGLASPFDILELHGQVNFVRYDPIDVQLDAEYAENLAFSKQSISNKGPVNNLGASPGNDQAGSYVGGNTGYYIRLLVGQPDIVKLNQWNAYAAYKYLASDAVVDAFTDSDFHLGGTNAKGFIIGAGYGLARNTYVNARWLSANEVSGPTYRNDVVQIDLNTKF